MTIYLQVFICSSSNGACGLFFVPEGRSLGGPHRGYFLERAYAAERQPRGRSCGLTFPHTTALSPSAAPGTASLPRRCFCCLLTSLRTAGTQCYINIYICYTMNHTLCKHCCWEVRIRPRPSAGARQEPPGSPDGTRSLEPPGAASTTEEGSRLPRSTPTTPRQRREIKSCETVITPTRRCAFSTPEMLFYYDDTG